MDDPSSSLTGPEVPVGRPPGRWRPRCWRAGCADAQASGVVVWDRRSGKPDPRRCESRRPSTCELVPAAEVRPVASQWHHWLAALHWAISRRCARRRSSPWRLAPSPPTALAAAALPSMIQTHPPRRGADREELRSAPRRRPARVRPGSVSPADPARTTGCAESLDRGRTGVRQRVLDGLGDPAGVRVGQALGRADTDQHPPRGSAAASTRPPVMRWCPAGTAFDVGGSLTGARQVRAGTAIMRGLRAERVPGCGDGTAYNVPATCGQSVLGPACSPRVTVIYDIPCAQHAAKLVDDQVQPPTSAAILRTGKTGARPTPAR